MARRKQIPQPCPWSPEFKLANCASERVRLATVNVEAFELRCACGYIWSQASRRSILRKRRQ